MSEDQESNNNDIGVLDNPAARLQYWLQRGSDHAAAARAEESYPGMGRERPTPWRIQTSWCFIWDLDVTRPPDRVEYMRRALGLLDAAKGVRSFAATTSNSLAEGVMSHFVEIEESLDYFMRSPDLEITAMMSEIDGTGWQTIRLMDQMMRDESREASVSPSALTDLITQTRELIDSLLRSDLNDEDMTLLVSKVQDVEAGLIRARITGMATVQDAADGLMGALVRLHLRGVDVMKNPATILAFGLISAIMQITGFAADLGELASSPFAELLGLPTGPSNGSP